MVVFEVGEAVAHVRLAAEKLVLPEHFAVTQDATGACQMLRQFTGAKFRAVTATAQFRVREVQVILALHDVIGELVAHRKAQAIRLAVVANEVEAGHLWFFASVFSKRRHRERLTRANDNTAVAFVEPFWLHTGLPAAGLPPSTPHLKMRMVSVIAASSPACWCILSRAEALPR